jgi:hypothetical protein
MDAAADRMNNDGDYTSKTRHRSAPRDSFRLPYLTFGVHYRPQGSRVPWNQDERTLFQALKGLRQKIERIRDQFALE